MKLATLLTDFGLQDGFVGVMKGVILGLCPEAHLVDLTHTIEAQNVLAGALTLERCFPYFPAGTVHLAVVDPGVGTQRRAMAARVGEQLVVGPDNGLFSLVFAQAERQGCKIEAVALDQPAFWRSEVSAVFHGRDIFAPVAAHLLNGVALAELGTPILDWVRLDLPQPERTPRGWRCQVTTCDHFGSLQTNLNRSDLSADKIARVRIGDELIEGLCNTFGDRSPGSLMALFDSSDHLSIAVVNGSALKRLGAAVGDEVQVEVE